MAPIGLCPEALPVRILRLKLPVMLNLMALLPRLVYTW